MERRIGERHRVSWLDLNWLVRRGRWRRHLTEERVETLDVSTTGIGLVARTVPALKVGQEVELRADDQQARAQIRRIVDADVPGSTFYGLGFIEPPSEFVEVLLAHAGAPLDGRLELYWRHSG
jgi:hypothetical protein